MKHHRTMSDVRRRMMDAYQNHDAAQLFGIYVAWKNAQAVHLREASELANRLCRRLEQLNYV